MNRLDRPVFPASTAACGSSSAWGRRGRVRSARKRKLSHPRSVRARLGSGAGQSVNDSRIPCDGNGEPAPHSVPQSHRLARTVSGSSVSHGTATDGAQTNVLTYSYQAHPCRGHGAISAHGQGQGTILGSSVSLHRSRRSCTEAASVWESRLSPAGQCCRAPGLRCTAIDRPSLSACAG